MKEKIKKMLSRVASRFFKCIKNSKKKFVNYWIGIFCLFLNIPQNTIKFLKAKKEYFIAFPQKFKLTLLKIRKIKPRQIYNFIINNAILMSLMILIIVLIISDRSLLSKNNVMNIVDASATKLIIALGAGTILVGRGTDLTAGRVVGLTAMVAATFSQDIALKEPYVREVLDHSPILILFIAMLIGAIVGIVNGLLVAKLKVPPFIATLGMMLAIYGLNIYYSSIVSSGQSIGSFNDKYIDFATKGFDLLGFKITWSVIISISIAIVMWIIWNKTPFGKKVFAVGGNPKAAMVSGISVSVVMILTYVIGGMLYGIGGTLEAWKNGTASVNTGTMYELDAIAAAIVGGLSFNGGKGKISGIVLGVLIFQTITYGFSYLGFGSSTTYIVKGLIIVSAVSLDMIKNRNS